MALFYPFTPALRDEYARLWDGASVLPKAKAAASVAAKRILANRSRYEEVERATGVPWEFIAILHDREASGSFVGVLHNGEMILGTGRKTRLVPKGRGPFTTWLAAAVDALRIKELDKLGEWSVERCLYECERFNGFGYRYRRLPSAYLWAGTSVYRGGKFVADGKFDPAAQDAQLGVAATMRALMVADPSITFARDGAQPIKVASAGLPSFGPGTWNDAGLKAVQTMLRDKGYALVGTPDGDWGDKTEDALESFQRINGLPVTRSYDSATAAALLTAPARPVSAAREAVTSKDLRKAGAGAVIGAWRAKMGAGLVMAGSTALGFVEGALGKLGAAGDLLGTVRDLLADVPPVVWALLLFAVAAVIYLQSRNAERAAVTAVRRGDDAGPVGLGDLRTARAPVEPDFDEQESEEEAPPPAVARPRAPRRRALSGARKVKPAKVAA